MTKTPKADYYDETQAFIDDMFYDSSDWYTIQEETFFASGEYVDLDVRINRVINPSTGANRGNDWKLLLFKDISKSIPLGSYFIFEDNYWIAVNTEDTVDLTSTCIVRRCNNTLRWYDVETGAKYSYPCVLGYVINENRDYVSNNSAVVQPSGLLTAISQLNIGTNKIQSSQRFLFGNASSWTSYRVEGGGINNFSNSETVNNTPYGLLTLTLGVKQRGNDEIDDLVNGYANARKLEYSISLDKSSISGQVGDTYQLDATVYDEGLTVDRDVIWESSDEYIATVVDGLVTFANTGNCSITVNLDGDADVNDSCNIVVNTTPISEYEIVVSPDKNYVLENDSESYNVTLELNGIDTTDVFVFNIVAGNVPVDNYVFTVVNGNNFNLENVGMYIEEELVIRCTSGIHSRDISIRLRGGW